ncbi:MAG TPA: O-antigen ligase family protein [Candidatus Acidoferrales bacterium]|nr:O-antigen ligase family protein [Candidatus Acidoferrales bacterium]
MKVVRVGICVLVAFSVLAFGTVEVWSESILEIGAAVLLLWWAGDIALHRDEQIYWPVICWPVLAFLAIGVLQLAFGGTAYPFLTRVALMKLLACALLFFLAIQSFRTRQDLKFLAWFLMCFGFFVAVFGIAQNYTSHNVLYWYRPLTRGGNPFGPYVNRDDFAGFMELIVPVGLCLLAFRGVRREQQAFVGVLTLVPIVALILTASRGGVVSFFCEIVLIALIARTHKMRFQALAASGLLVVAVGVVAWLGAGKVLGRVESSNLHELSADRRVSMLRGAWNIFRSHPLTGTGLGTLVAVYPKYETHYDGRIVDHVHDDYAELLAETGLAGGLCGLIFLIVLFGTAQSRLAQEQSTFSQAIHTAGIVACFGLLVHGFVDFNFHIPANGLLFLVQVSVVISPTFRRRAPSTGNRQSYKTSTIDIQTGAKS